MVRAQLDQAGDGRSARLCRACNGRRAKAAQDYVWFGSHLEGIESVVAAWFRCSDPVTRTKGFSRAFFHAGRTAIFWVVLGRALDINR